MIMVVVGMEEPPAGTYAVIGASGLIGSHVLLGLASKPNISVLAVCHERDARVSAPNITPVFTDASDPGSLAHKIDGTDFVVMAAGIPATAPLLARDPVGTVLSNLYIFIGALSAAYQIGCKRCVWLSGTTGFPIVNGDITEEIMFQGDPPESWYGIGWTNRFLETQCQWYAEKVPQPLPITILRPSMVYGEYANFDDKTAHFLPSLIKRVVQRNDPIEVWGNGEQTRDLIYAGDVAKAIFLALKSDKRFSTYNLGSGKIYSINECLSLLLGLDGYRDATVKYMRDKPTSTKKQCISIDLIKAELGFTPSVELKTGLRRTLNWYKKTHYV